MIGLDEAGFERVHGHHVEEELSRPGLRLDLVEDLLGGPPPYLRLDEGILLRERVEQGLRVGKDRKSTRLNSSHTVISYAVFCLKKKKQIYNYIDNYYANKYLSE